MRHGTYVGKDEDLKGKTALLQEDPTTNAGGNFGLLLAQFDDIKNLPRRLTHGWTLYSRWDFELDVEKVDSL